MIEFIIKYWIQTLLTLLVGGLSFLCRKIWKMYKNEQQHQKTEEYGMLKKELKQTIQESIEASIEGDVDLQNQIDLLKRGILSLHGKNFKQQCHDLLKEEHEITIEEYEGIQQDYDIYTSLGGNGQGKILYNLVCEKAINHLKE